MRAIALIHNPGSGSSGEVDLVERLEESGVSLEQFPIERAAEAAGAGVERIVVAGGDGSIGPAAAAACAAGVELAVIPAGTANDFAARMKLPEGIEEALMVAAAGTRTRQIDLARIGDRPFVNVASLGLAPAAADAADDLKPTLGALAYTVGALQAAASEEPLACEVRCNGEPLFEGDAWQVIVGCTGAFGGGSRIDADADDGLLDVVVIEGGPRSALAKRAFGLRTGGVEDQAGVRHARAEKISITVDASCEFNVDGELVSTGDVGGRRVGFSVQPRALELVTG